MSAPDFAPIVIGSRGQEQPPWFKILAPRVAAYAGDRRPPRPRPQGARAALHVPKGEAGSKFDGLIGRSGRSLSLNS